jgi:SAM-dependent methyltransferase
MSAVPLYDAFAEGYDLMTDWPARLASESGFLNGLFAAHDVYSVLDAACGTGQHAGLFAGWGLNVTATDLSQAMLARARSQASTAGVRFVLAGFGQHGRLAPGPYDAVTCLGNSLPHVANRAGLAAALADFRAVLRPGGLLVLQNNNYDAILGQRQRFMGVTGRIDGDRELLFFRFFDLEEPSLRFHVVTFAKQAGAWTFTESNTRQLPLLRDGMMASLAAAGFAGIESFGDLKGAAFEPSTSPNLVLVARAARE